MMQVDMDVKVTAARVRTYNQIEDNVMREPNSYFHCWNNFGCKFEWTYNSDITSIACYISELNS